MHEAAERRGVPPLRALLGFGLLVFGAGLALIGASRPGPSISVAGPEKPVAAGARDQADIRANNSPTLARSPVDPDTLVVVNRVDTPQYSCALHRSADGGATWRAGAIPFPAGEELPERCFAPDAAFGSDGTLYVVFTTLKGLGNSPNAVWISSMERDGRVLSTPRRPDSLARAVGGAVAADRGYLHPASPWSKEAARPPAPASGPAPAPPAGTVRVLAPDNDPVKLEAGRRVVLAMERAGMDAELVRVPRDELVRAVGEDGSPPSFQAAIWTAPALASYDPTILGRLFGSDPRDALSNLSGYRSPVFDAAADRIATTPDRAARQTAVDDALRALAADVPVVPLFFSDGAFAYRPAVFDGWVFVRGTGILDKRSFVEPRPAGATRAQGAKDDTGGGRSYPFGWGALAVLGVAGILGLRLLTGRPDGRRSSS